MSDVTDVEWFRGEARSCEQNAVDCDARADRLKGLTDAMYPGGSRMAPEAVEDATRWRARAARLDRAASALEREERAKGAEPLDVRSEPFMGGEQRFRVISHDIVRPTEAEPNVRHAFALRLIRTALDLLEEP